MQSAFLQYGDSRIHYLLGGEGKTLLVCLHGYGESAQTFSLLEPVLGERFKILAIDLPYHGQTHWAGGLEFRPGDLEKILFEIIFHADSQAQDQAAGDGTGRSGDLKIYLLGYSMGGRAALQLFENMPGHIERLMLMAPDGLVVNFWYWLATQTLVGNRIFRFSMRHPGWLFLILRTGHLLHLVNPGIYKFTLTYIDHALVRDNLYKRWMVMRKFKPRLARIRSNIRERHTPVRLLYGQYDRIILAKRGAAFMRGIESYCRLVTVDTGHYLLKEKYLETIMNMLEDKE